MFKAPLKNTLKNVAYILGTSPLLKTLVIIYISLYIYIIIYIFIYHYIYIKNIINYNPDFSSDLLIKKSPQGYEAMISATLLRRATEGTLALVPGDLGESGRGFHEFYPHKD